ncbi:hypothetical protein SAMN04487950_2966 [Halogranum rubrum]|uniref:Uncharacterized protein n=2 Tax=Halogranum rubrum TaxID=553466 RepID=A0A1I4G1B9_9EURY|nr:MULTISPECIES: hypothetical protein [Halogranum]EJN59498.1 hypothetical protein HSB1_16560 [Halogranum salarium B-1]SFL23529.1 hypothetical protein SAMN04487950_2966 [Halogranum rubrum]
MRASMGIMDTVGLAASLVFAIPVAIFGMNRLLDGQQLFGAGLLLVAALMVLLPQKLTTPMDIPQKVAGKAVGKAVKEPDDEKN